MRNFKLGAPAQSICILRLSALGDITHMLPVVRTLQNQWPECHISWVIGKTEYQLVEGMENIEFIIFDKSQGFAAFKTLWQNLRHRQFDILLHMQAALRASIASRIIQASVRVGFDRDRAADFQWLFTNHKIAANPRKHVLEGFFGFLQAIGIEQRTMVWDAPIPKTAKHFAALHVKDNRRALVVNPCSSVRKNNYRNWRPEGYAKVIDYAIEQLGMDVIITGGPADNERNMARDICEQSSHDPLDLTGKTTIKQMLAVLQAADVIIAPDTGPAHMGTAVGTPVIGLYVTSNPDRSGPYNDIESVVNFYPEAVRQEFGKDVQSISWGKRVRNPNAINLITVDSVIAQLDRTIQTLSPESQA